MKDNYESVQKGFRILITALSGYIGQQLRKVYRDDWWDEVLRALNDPFDLPRDGEYGELVDALDVANCLRLIDRMWGDVFRNVLPPSCRAWAKELMGVRNLVAHHGQQDMDQHVAERALDTMQLLVKEIDPDSAKEIRKLYKVVRGRDDTLQKAAPEALAGLAQPAAASKRGELAEGSLLRKVGTALVRKTTLTRKVTYDGKTVVYPVYRVRLDALYYNDQNDRIATWITRYESENGEDSLTGMGRDIYNMVIENFIVESNPDAIRKTRNNIALVGQREPGVALADGRIVDGNRRFTCLRQLQRETAEPLYFETVLMDVDIQEDKKQLKLLELAIQHGEEKKVDYDLIDFAVGTYRDVVETRLLTQEEYAAAANESPSEVKARLEIAGLISEFLTFLRLPGQYHAAREYQVYNVFAELRAPLRQLESDDRAQLKTIVFNNTMMAAIPDQRKFIRDIKALVKSGNYQSYFKEQAELDAAIREKRAECDVRSKEDLDRFAAERDELAVKLRLSMERAMLRSRSQQLRAKPAENIGKSVTLLMEIDPRQFDKLDADEREKVRSGLEELSRLLESFRNRL